MERPKEEGPSHPGQPGYSHHQFMSEQHNGLIRKLRNSECVMAMKPRWTSESKPHGSPWFICVHHIAHGPMPTRRTGTEWPIQSHRWPLSPRPQPVLLGRQGIQHLSDRFSARMYVSLVNVLDHALRLAGGDDSAAWLHPSTSRSPGRELHAEGLPACSISHRATNTKCFAAK